MGDVRTIGIWLRVSTEDQVKGESPQHHEARARAYVLSKGWDVATVYNLGGFSGKSVKDHPECKRMMEVAHLQDGGNDAEDDPPSWRAPGRRR